MQCGFRKDGQSNNLSETQTSNGQGERIRQPMDIAIDILRVTDKPKIYSEIRKEARISVPKFYINNLRELGFLVSVNINGIAAYQRSDEGTAALREFDKYMPLVDGLSRMDLSPSEVVVLYSKKNPDLLVNDVIRRNRSRLVTRGYLNSEYNPIGRGADIVNNWIGPIRIFEKVSGYRITDGLSLSNIIK